MIRTFSSLLPALLAGLLLAPIQKAWGWGDLGHQTIAEIAERHLSEAGKHFVTQTLGAEPLATASLFADLVRPDTRFDPFVPYHYIEIPPGLTPKTLTPKNRAKKDAHLLLTQAPSLLLDPSKSPNQKRLLFRYLIHALGDIHQPLHVGNGLDRGGSLCTVQWREVSSEKVIEVNLHSVWDDRIFDYVAEDFYSKNPRRRKERRRISYVEYADAILREAEKQPAIQKKDLQEVAAPNFTTWYEEAIALHSNVYPDQKETKPQDREYCKVNDKSKPDDTALGLYDPAKVPTVQADYARRSLKIAERQILKAGYRLAAMINRMAVQGVPAKFDPLEHKKLVESVLIENPEGR